MKSHNSSKHESSLALKNIKNLFAKDCIDKENA